MPEPLLLIWRNFGGIAERISIKEFSNTFDNEEARRAVFLAIIHQKPVDFNDEHNIPHMVALFDERFEGTFASHIRPTAIRAAWPDASGRDRWNSPYLLEGPPVKKRRWRVEVTAPTTLSGYAYIEAESEYRAKEIFESEIRRRPDMLHDILDVMSRDSRATDAIGGADLTIDSVHLDDETE